MTDYYFADAGNDTTGDGTIGNPYKSITKANEVVADGDQAFFNGGDTFVGKLELVSNCNYTSYGTGKAILQNAADSAVLLDNQSDVLFFTIILDGVDELTNDNHGFNAVNSHNDDTQLTNVTVYDVEVREFGHNGINFDAINYQSGFTDVVIDACHVHDCTAGHNASGGTAGIRVGSETLWGAVTYGYPFNTVTISNNTVEDCRGKAGAPNHTGSGIILSQCEIFEITANHTENCGENSTSQAGPVGQWCWDCIDGVIKEGTAFYQKSAGPDGAGFDIDGGCQRVVMEFNFALECAGPGILLFSFPDEPEHEMPFFTDNIARFNLSVRCGLTSASKYGAFIGTSRNNNFDFQRVHFYNNTIVTDDMNGHIPDCFQIWSYQGTSTDHFSGVVANNVFLQLGSGLVFDFRKSAMNIFGNVYYNVAANSVRVYGFDYTILDDFLGATEDLGMVVEQVGETVTAVWSDPLLSNSAGSVIANFAPTLASPALTSGLPLDSYFGLPVPTHDLQGNTLTPVTQWVCGAIWQGV